MSTPDVPVAPPGGVGGDGAPPTQTVASRLSEHLRFGGIVTPIVTTVIAFLAGGLVVAVTGHDPFATYKAIFNGTGLQWLFPWTSGAARDQAALNFQQTLIRTTPLILTGLAVAYAFRTGLFNIGGNGQYLVGSIVAAWVGSSFAGMTGVLHVVLTIALASLAGALWAGIAGLLRATVGANEVISSIMLNYIAIAIGSYLFGLGGPLQSSGAGNSPVSNDIAQGAKLPVFWGDPDLQGLHIGIFIALLAAVGFWLLLNRSKRGYEARAVGFNPEAARYAGIDVGRTYFRVMATCGMFAGLAGALDVLGWQFRVATNDIQTTQLGFLGIAVALLGRNTALGTCLAALLFGGLLQGTSVRYLDPTIFPPALAGNLTTIIQGLVVLIVSVDVLVVFLFRRRRRRPRGESAPATVAEVTA